MSVTAPEVRKILSPFDERQGLSLKEAAPIAGSRTLRDWCDEHGPGRRIGSRAWSVSRIALVMFLDGDKTALQAYHSGDRTGAPSSHIFKRIGLAKNRPPDDQ